MIKKISKRFADLIKKDTTIKNESVKTMIVIRILILTVFFYFIVNFLLNWHILDGRGIVISCLYVLAFGVLFVSSYHIKVRTAATIFSIAMLLFIGLNLQWFGWWVGVQHFLIVLLVLEFFVGYDGFRTKMYIAVLICAIRIAFYFHFHNIKAIYEIPPQREDFLQIMNTIIIFWCISLISYVFGKDSRALEGKLVKYNEELEREALTDNLTGLANRRRAMDYVQQILKESENRNFSLCMCDIDFFKKVNDTWGHDCGDLVLKQIARIFKENVGNGNMPCRWGGEEFLLLFPNNNGDEAYDILVTIQNAIKQMVVEYEGKQVRVTMTFGLTEVDFHNPIETSIQEADEKLYYGKNHGRDQIVF